MSKKKLTSEQVQTIEDTLKSNTEKEKLYEYLIRNDIVGIEIFSYLNNSKFDSKFIYEPVMYDVFIRRLPIYFYEQYNSYDGDNYDYIQTNPNKPKVAIPKHIGDFTQYALSDMKRDSKDLESLYSTVEKMYYHHKLDLRTIFNYPIDQTGYCSRKDFLMQWAHYLDLAVEYGVEEKMPKRFLVTYNYMLERAGMKPIIYEIKELYSGEYIHRAGNVIRVEGVFPCEDGIPIMRWIGLEIKNPTKIWSEINERSEGNLYIEINSKTAIWGLNCWNDDDDWYLLYGGPLLMEFDYEKLKEHRRREKLTQKQVAEAIGAAERTYQKWESGDTSPDCIYLLRLINVLDIKDVYELTKINI